MKRKMVFLLIIMLLVLIQISFALDKRIQKFIKKYEKAAYVEITFQQEVVLSLTNIVQKKNGKILFASGSNQFRIEDEDQIICSDGNAFFRLNRQNNQLTIDYAKKDQDLSFFQQLFRKPEDYFSITLIGEEKGSKGNILQFKFIPVKDQNQLVKEVKVWLNEKENQLMKVQITDLNDNLTTYLILQIRELQKISSDQFTIPAPENGEVIDLRL